MAKKISYIYFGSSTFSKIILQGLCTLGHDPLLVVTKPDKPKGRGLKVFPTEVFDFVSTKSITCLKPVSLKDPEFLDEIKNNPADYFIVADYGNIIPVSVLDIPNVFSICAHPSMLPIYRGAAPIEYTLLNGDKNTGVTIFKINQRVDSGDIILKNQLSIDSNDNYITLREKLAKLSVGALIESIKNIDCGKHDLIPQNGSKASLTHKLTKLSGRISWSNTARDINNLIRATIGWPSAYTYYKGSILKVLSAQAVPGYTSLELPGKYSQEPGTILKVDKEGIFAATKEDVLKIIKVQPQGKKEMGSWSFACGHRVKVGDKFTDDNNDK